MSKEFPLGQPLVADATFTVAGAPTDPTAITFTIEEPDGTVLEFEWPPDSQYVAKITTGVFQGQYTPTKVGRHAYRMEGTGAAAGVIEEEFLVTSLVTGVLQIVYTPEDMEGIRNLLGVTVLDVPNEVIERRPFGLISEAQIMAQIEDWEDVKDAAALADPVALMRWQFISTATQYLIAAQIARTMAKGGFVGLVRPEGGRTAKDWEDYADQLQTMAEGYAAQGALVDPNEADNVANYLFPIMLISGPTTKRERQSDWALNQYPQGN